MIDRRRHGRVEPPRQGRGFYLAWSLGATIVHAMRGSLNRGRGEVFAQLREGDCA